MVGTFSFFQQSQGVLFTDLKNQILNAMSEGTLSQTTSCLLRPAESPRAFLSLFQGYCYVLPLSLDQIR